MRITDDMPRNDKGEIIAPNGDRYNSTGAMFCHAQYPDGNYCRRLAMKGQRVCIRHGGSTKAAKRNAQIRLSELVGPAVATLGNEMMTAEKSQDRQRAANSILDRSGLPRSTSTPGDEAIHDILKLRLAEIRKEKRQQSYRERERERNTLPTWTGPSTGTSTQSDAAYAPDNTAPETIDVDKDAGGA